MSTAYETGPERTMVAATDLEPFRMVKQDASGLATYTGTSDKPEGVTMERVLAGQAVRVMDIKTPAPIKVTASAAIAAGGSCLMGNNGMVSAAGTITIGRCVGIAAEKTTSTASGDVLLMQAIPQ